MNYDDDIMGALVRGEDPDVAVNRVALRYAVQHQIFCKVSGKILDVRTAVLVTVTTGHDGPGIVVLDGTVWAKVEPDFRAKAAHLGAALEVIDGRELHGSNR